MNVKDCPVHDLEPSCVLSELKEKHFKERLNNLKNHLCHTLKNMHDLNTTNSKLVEEMTELKQQCRDIKNQLVDQKINELHCVAKLMKIVEILKNENKRKVDTLHLLVGKMSETINNMGNDIIVCLEETGEINCDKTKLPTETDESPELVNEE